jgi:hypothetical protein
LVIGDISVGDLGEAKDFNATWISILPCLKGLQARAASAELCSTAHHSKVVVEREVPDQRIDVDNDSQKPHKVKGCAAPAIEGHLLLQHHSLLLYRKASTLMGFEVYVSRRF